MNMTNSMHEVHVKKQPPVYNVKVETGGNDMFIVQRHKMHFSFSGTDAYEFVDFDEAKRMAEQCEEAGHKHPEVQKYSYGEPDKAMVIVHTYGGLDHDKPLYGLDLTLEEFTRDQDRAYHFANVEMAMQACQELYDCEGYEAEVVEFVAGSADPWDATYAERRELQEA